MDGSFHAPPSISGRLLTRIRHVDRIFLFTAVIPTLLAIIYFGLIATDTYVSESQFVVRRPDKPSSSGFGILLKSAGFSNASDEMYAAQAYVTSRDALRQLNEHGQFAAAYQEPHVSLPDRFNPTGLFGSTEDLYQFYLRKIAVNYDPASSIGTLTVRAYSSRDAQAINEHLLRLTEQTVNRLNQRARSDLVRVAQQEVDEAKNKARAAAIALARFRNTSGIIDPEKQASIQLQMISKLQDQLIATNTQLAQLRRFAPDNSQVTALTTAAQSLRKEIDERTKDVAGNSRSLSGVAVEYQRLFIDSQFADRQLTAMLTSLEDARAEARKQQAYIERISQPNLPDAAMEPRRIRGILTTFILGLVAFGIISMLAAGIREHKD